MVSDIRMMAVLAGVMAALTVLFLYTVTRPQGMDLRERLHADPSYVRSYVYSNSRFGSFYRKKLSRIVPEGSLMRFGASTGTDIDSLQEKIEAAGLSDRISAIEVAAIKLIAVTASVIGFLAFAASRNMVVLLLTMFLSLSLYLLPEARIKERFRERQDDISAQLPHFIENTYLCIRAGAGLEESLRYIAQTSEGELGAVVRKAFVDASYTGSWEDELTAAAARLKVDAFEDFAGDIVMAMKTGADIEDTLRAEVDKITAVSEARIMGEIKKLPSKLSILQMAFCMLPMIVIVMLPVLIQLLGVL